MVRCKGRLLLFLTDLRLATKGELLFVPDPSPLADSVCSSHALSPVKVGLLQLAI